MLDRAILCDHVYGDQEWGASDKLIEWFDPASLPQRWLRVTEILVGDLLERAGGAHPDPLVEEFDKAAFDDPNMNIGDFADEHGIKRPSLEWLIKKAYGQTPKRVLRRAPVLNIAADLRGVADDAEADELVLRYFDQSHLIREFAAFFGTMPSAFRASPRTLMTLNLEIRQARRLEELDRLRPRETRPWFLGEGH